VYLLLWTTSLEENGSLGVRSFSLEMEDVFRARVHNFAVLEDTHAFAFDKYVGGRGGGDVGGVNVVVETEVEAPNSGTPILFF